MKCFTDPNWEIWLVCLECDAVSYQRAEHHLWTIHEIVHNIFKLWHKSHFIDQIKVNFLICGNLKSDITFDEVNVTSHFWNNMILCPKMGFWIYFEEQNRTWRSNNECLIKQEVHWTKICRGNLFAERNFRILRIDSETMTLSVESVNLVIDRTIEGFHWEV